MFLQTFGKGCLYRCSNSIDKESKSIMVHEQNCTFKDFHIILTNHNPYGPDQSLTVKETGVIYDSNVTLDTDTKNDVDLFFNYCPMCGCKLND